MKKINISSEKNIHLIMGAVLVIVLGAIVLFANFQRRKLVLEDEKNTGGKHYQYHVAMIVKDSSDTYWQFLYEAARDKGKEDNIYIENFGSLLNKEYERTELVEMAIAAKVDGIILEAENTEEMRKVISEAKDNAIPVMTIGTDAPGSKRISFVTANDYAIGVKYGEDITSLAKTKGENLKVTVLLPLNKEGMQPNLVYSAIREMVDKAEKRISISTLSTGEKDDFESEEMIRNLLVSPEEERPEAIVCLNAADTMSAYQSVVDYNLVGKVEIIGSYITPQILEGIEKGIIHSSLVTDAAEMGKLAATGMNEYLTTEYISEYLSAQSELVTADNVDQYLEKDE